MTEFRFVYVTCPDRNCADRISRVVIEEGLAACMNLLPGMESRYVWKGQIEVAQEVVLIIKSDEMRWDRLQARLLELHPYEVPCILALPILTGNEAYLQWLTDSMNLPPKGHT